MSNCCCDDPKCFATLKEAQVQAREMRPLPAAPLSDIGSPEYPIEKADVEPYSNRSVMAAVWSW